MVQERLSHGSTTFTHMVYQRLLPGDGVPAEAQLERQASDLGRRLEACLKVEGCDLFTVWGLVDTYSWVPAFFPDQGAATLMSEDLTREPACYELQRLVAEARSGGQGRSSGASLGEASQGDPSTPSLTGLWRP